MSSEYPLDALSALDNEAAQLPPTEVLEASAPEPPAEIPGPDPALAQIHVPGYVVLRILERGGMGVIYQARDVRRGRLVALKMVLAGTYASAMSLLRFRLEAEVLAQVQHPNIIQIYEISEYNQLPYLVLEYCSGGTLQDRQMNRLMLPNEAAALVEKLAQAIHTAHQAGIIHRDLKPSNVLFREDGTPKITDFGLAKKFTADDSPTHPNAVLGTPSYMAPEQARRTDQKVGPAVDIYALGAILYKLLTGRPPFQAPTSIETLMQVVNNEPVRPRLLQPKIPRDLETICLQCLQKDPALRYPSAAVLAADLQRFQQGRTIVARPASLRQRAVKFLRHHPLVASLLLLLLLVTGFAIGGISLALQRAWDGQRQALASRAETELEKRKTDRANEELKYTNRRLARTVANSKIHLAQAAWQADAAEQAFAELHQVAPAERYWEWHYLHRKFEGGLRIFQGPQPSALAIACSADGKFLASGGGKNNPTIQIRLAATGQALHSLQDQFGHTQDLCFHPTQAILASAHDDGGVRLWDAASGKRIGLLHNPEGAIYTLAFHPQGRLLATAGAAPSIHVWDWSSRQLARSIAAPVLPTLALAFSPDGRWLARGGPRGTLTLYQTADGKPAQHLETALKQIDSVAISADGEYLACSGSQSGGKSVLLWSLPSRTLIHTFDETARGPIPLAFHPEGKALAMGVGDQVKVWQVPTAKLLCIHRGHRSAVNRLVFAPTGKHLFTTSMDQTIKVWPALTAEPAPFSIHPHFVEGSVALHPAGQILAVAGHDLCIRLFRLADGREIFTSARQPSTVLKLAFSPGGEYLAAADQDKRVQLWRIKPETGTLTPAEPAAPLPVLLRLPAKNASAAAVSPACVLIWNGPDHPASSHSPRWPSDTSGLALSRDQHWLAIGFPSGEIELWNTQEGKMYSRWQAHARVEGNQLLALSPDGKLLASTTTGDKPIRIWHLQGETSQVCVCDLQKVVGDLSFTADGQRVLAGDREGTLHIWDARTGQPLLTEKRQPQGITQLLFGPRDAFLLTVSRAGMLHRWDARRFTEAE